MKNNRKAVEARQRDILDYVRSQGTARVEDIARLFQISTMTVRRDLQLLEQEQLLKRTHGGAISLEQERKENRGDVTFCRERISAYTAQFIEDGERIFINGSRTALGVLKYLGEKKVSVYTNNGWAVMEEYPPWVEVHFTGGKLCEHIMIGEYVVRNILGITANRTLIGCAAVYDDGQFRYDIPTEIGINEAMISRTKNQLFILADHTKLQRKEERVQAYGSCIYNRPCTLITDELANPEIVERLRSFGIEVLVVPLSDEALIGR